MYVVSCPWARDDKWGLFMGDFSLYKLFVYYMRKFHIIVAFAVIFAIGGYFYETEVKVPMYKADTSIMLVQKQTKVTDINKYYENITLNKKLVSDYSELLESRKVLSQVKENLGLGRKVEKLKNQISVWTTVDTSMIYISVQDKKSDVAVRIADELANVFKSEVKELFNLENVQIIDEAVEETSPNNINVERATLLAGIIGITLACGILFLYAFIKSKGNFDTILLKKKEKKDKKEKNKKSKK